MSSSWISRTLCTAPSVVSLDTVEEDCYSSSSLDECSPHKLNPSQERIVHVGFLGDHESLQLEVGFDSGTSIEVHRVAGPDRSLQEAKLISKQMNRTDYQKLRKKDPLTFFFCNSLDNWYYEDEEREEKEEIRVAVDVPKNKNSCSHPQSRRRRMELLRINLSPFQTDEVALAKQSISSKYSPVEMNKRAFSFSDADVKTPSSVTKRYSSYGDQNRSSLLEMNCNNACAFATVESSSSLNLGNDGEVDERICYDSDPGEIFSPLNNDIHTNTPKKNFRQYFLFDDDMMFNQTWSNVILVWHRHNQQNCSNTNPTAVRAWIENGSYIRNGLIHPKLMWQETFGRDKKANRTVLNAKDLHAIDLLDIFKVVPFKNCHRQLYPFVKKDSTFIIGYGDFQLVFEAENQKTRDILMESLKRTIARLGSMIMTGDHCVLDEFFSPMGNSVPGNAPHILQV